MNIATCPSISLSISLRRHAMAEKKSQFPPQHQEKQPGRQNQMTPEPAYDAPFYKGSGKLADGVALLYLDEHDDAAETCRLVEAEGRRCLTLAGDVGDESFCHTTVRRTLDEFGRLDILVNNAAEQHLRENIEDISAAQLERTFRTNIFSMFYMTKAAVPHLQPGSAIINTTSITAYHGHPVLLDYASTKGAIVAFTRSLALNLVEQGIRVNAVAPGPIWTPLIPASFPDDKVETFGSNTPMIRAGQPEDVAPCYGFLAAPDSKYMSGQVLHPNGGQVING